MEKSDRIVIVGRGDLIEESLIHFLKENGFTHVVSTSAIGLDILQHKDVDLFFAREQPRFVFLTSVRSGGIEANQRWAADFIRENLLAQTFVIHAAHAHKVKKLLYLGSSCVYPRDTTQPIKEESLLTGALEPTSEAYAIAKIAGIKMCQAYRRQYGCSMIAAIPATVYGPGEAEQETAHVLEALVHKFAAAIRGGSREVVIWGTGSPRREFIYAEDFAAGAVFLMEHYDAEEIVNIGCGQDISIKDLAALIAELSGYPGKIVFDRSRPDGAQQKLLDNSRITQLGWKPRVDLRNGIQRMLNKDSQ